MKFYISKHRLSTTIATAIFACSIVFCVLFYLLVVPVSSLVDLCEYIVLPAVACALYILAIMVLGKKAPWFSLISLFLCFVYLIVMSKKNSIGNIAFVLTILLYVAVFLVYVLVMMGVFKINSRLICRIVFSLPLLYRIVTAIYICAFVYKDDVAFQEHIIQNVAPYVIEALILSAILTTIFSLRHKRVSRHHSSSEKAEEN